MRLWQRVDSAGRSRYSLVPVALSAPRGTNDGARHAIGAKRVKGAERGKKGTRAAKWATGKGPRLPGTPPDAKVQTDKTNRPADSLGDLSELAVDLRHTCERCGIEFPVGTMLTRHKMSHRLGHQAKRISAADSRARRSKPNPRKKPPRERSTNHWYACDFCEFACDRSIALTMHVSKKHTPGIAVAKADSVKVDARKGHGRPVCERQPDNEQTSGLACGVCAFQCKRSTTLASHVARCHGNSDGDGDRTKCGSKSLRKSKGRADSSNGSPSDLLPNVSLNDSPTASPNDSSNDSRTRPLDRSGNEQLACTFCDFRCKKTATLAAHATKKHAKKNLEERCDLCDFECSKKSTLYSHKRRHKLQNEVFACNECGFKTANKSSLYSHIKRKHKIAKSCTGNEQPELYYCNQCDYKNKNKYELKVHVARKHTDDFKFSCETCGKKFKVKGDLTNHIRFSHREQPVICDVCGKTCLNSNSLYVHQKFAHYKAKYECKVCKRRMVSQENLNEHVLRQHERRENVVCEECGKTFSRNSRLKVHMRIHTGDKPYSCSICGKSFARRTALKQHLLIHTGIRPYVCDICGKAFTQKPGLISHRKSHPGSHPPLPRVLIDHILNDVMNN